MMLTLLDVRTLFFSGALTTGMFALLMVLTLRTGKAYPGHQRWTFAEISFAILFLMQCIRGYIPEIFPVMIGNAVVVSAMVMLAEGMRQFCGKRWCNQWIYLGSALYLTAILYYFFIIDDFRMRTLASGLYMALMSGYASLPLLGRVSGTRRFGYRLAAAVLLIGAAVGFARVIAVADATNIDPFFYNRPINSFFYLFMVSYVIGITFSLMMLIGERQLAEAQDFSRTLMHEVHERHRVERKLLDEIAERQALEAQLRELAVTDPLTGVLNRRGFFSQLQTEVQRACRFPSPLAVLALDVDRFKEINDTYGHYAGDQALLMLATTCQSNLRILDKIGRIGGEEFAVILPGTDVKGAAIIAEKLRRSVEDMRVQAGNIPHFALTVSIGVAAWKRHDTSGEDVLHQADRALYAAKEAGRNRSCTLAV